MCQPSRRPLGVDVADAHRRAYAAWTKQSAEVNFREFDFSYVATNQMGDRSVLEPMKVVPSRDITPGRRKEPMNRG